MEISLDDVLGGGSSSLLGIPKPAELGYAYGKFGKAEVEEAANTLIDFFKKKERWGRFHLSELMDFAEKKGKDKDAVLVGLMGYWINSPDLPPPLCHVCAPAPFIVFDESGGMYVTRFFTERMQQKALP